MKKKVLIVGGTGFVGRNVVDTLAKEGHTVFLLIRHGSNAPEINLEKIKTIIGDPFSPESYSDAMEHAEIVINCAGIIREKRSKGITFERIHFQLNQTLLQQAVASGVRKFILISALGVSPDGVSKYQTSKFRAEQEIANSGLDYVIFRPSFVLGKNAGFLKEIAPLVRLPITPVFGDGEYRFEPVDVRVLAAAVERVVNDEEIKEVTFEFREAKTYSFNQILDLIGKALGKTKVNKIHIPLWFARPMIKLTQWLPFSPVTTDQLDMLVQGNLGTGRNAIEELGLKNIPLEESIMNAIQKAL